MLKELSVIDFAIVGKASVVFPSGFCVLTGETGAGKSILIGALELALGGRPSDDMIKSGAAKTSVEALFDLADSPAAAVWLEENGLDTEEGEVIIRRVVSREGKNRVFINGAHATVAQVRELSGALVDIHGQHETQGLFHPSRHLDLFDRASGFEEEVLYYATAFDRWKNAVARLQTVTANERELEIKIDLLSHQAGEIADASLTPGEEEALRTEKNILSNAERLLALAQEAATALDGEAGSASDQCGAALAALEKMADLDAALSPVRDAVASALIGIEEAASEARSYASKITADPGRLEEVDDRLDLLRSLKKKYGETVAEVIAFGHRAEEELQALEEGRQSADELAEEVSRLGGEAAALAIDLDNKRKGAARRFEEKVARELADLAMPKAALALDFSYEPDPDSPCVIDGQEVRLTRRGAGRLEMKFSANPGETPKALAKIASGGEISRIMLAIKSALAEQQPAPVMIFDEIDAGVGGVTADRVGEKLGALAQNSQVFCVTHLAQVASQAGAHYCVEKMSGPSSASVTVTRLDRDGRVRELARMAGGEQAPEAAAAWAEKALSTRQG